MQIVIRRRPIGEAPPWVRDAWIGMSLPVVVARESRRMTFGALTGPKSIWQYVLAIMFGRQQAITGFVVNAGTAIRLLGTVNPAAAAWWMDNAPEFASGRYDFVFDSDCCELVERRGPWDRSA